MMSKLNEIDSKFNLLFSKKNYLLMLVGVAVILIGFLLMTVPMPTQDPMAFMIRTIGMTEFSHGEGQDLHLL